MIEPSEFKSLMASHLASKPGFETSAVRVSVSAGYVVLQGYVAEPEQIDEVVHLAQDLSGTDRVKCFLFCWQ